MKKGILIILLALFTVLISSCILNNCFYMYVQNMTDKTITVTVQEDPEAYVSKVLGPQTQTLTLLPGELKRTNIVDNSFFKITANGEVVNYIDDSDPVINRKGDYDLIGENALVVIKKTDEKYYFDWAPRASSVL